MRPSIPGPQDAETAETPVELPALSETQPSPGQTRIMTEGTTEPLLDNQVKLIGIIRGLKVLWYFQDKNVDFLDVPKGPLKVKKFIGPQSVPITFQMDFV